MKKVMKKIAAFVMTLAVVVAMIPSMSAKADYYEVTALSSDPNILKTQLANPYDDIVDSINTKYVYFSPLSDINSLNPNGEEYFYIDLPDGEKTSALGTLSGIPVVSEDQVNAVWYDYDDSPDMTIVYHVGYCDLSRVTKSDENDYEFYAYTEYVGSITPASRDMSANIKEILPQLPNPQTQFYIVAPEITYRYTDSISGEVEVYKNVCSQVFIYESAIPGHIMRPVKSIFQVGIYDGEVFRFYNESTGGHLYTIDVNESKSLVDGNWITENSQGYCDISQKGPAIYRLYNPSSNEYIFTADKNEARTLKKKFGWNIENGEAPVFYGAKDGSVKVYRMFNPTLPAESSHHYTSDENEISKLSASGWVVDNDGAPVYSLYNWSEYYKAFVEEK